MCPADWRIEQIRWNIPVHVSDWGIAYYGHPGVRHQTIEDLRAISEYIQAIEDRVVIGGDFNLAEDAVVTVCEHMDAAMIQSIVTGQPPENTYSGGQPTRPDRIWIPGLAEQSGPGDSQ